MIEDVFGLLCEARLATMSELLDPLGPWSLDMIATMAPVALLQVTARKKSFFRAVMCGIGALAQGGGEAATTYARELDETTKKALGDQGKWHGDEIPDPVEEGASTLEALLRTIPTKKG